MSQDITSDETCTLAEHDKHTNLEDEDSTNNVETTESNCVSSSEFLTNLTDSVCNELSYCVDSVINNLASEVTQLNDKNYMHGEPLCDFDLIEHEHDILTQNKEEEPCKDNVQPLCDFDLIEHDILTQNVEEEPCKDNSIKQTRWYKKKLKRILTSIVENDVEYQREAAVDTAGLLNDEIRQKVWPALVGVDVFETSPRPSQEEIESHPYYNQVVLDVNRSISRFPPSIKEKQRLSMQDQLVFLIMRVLVRHPEFHYYQGYHDICVTFLLVLGEETAYHVVERLSVSHLNVFMEKTMEPTIRLISYMYPLIGKERPELQNFLIKSEVGVAYCLSWLITWFGHVLNNYDNVVRLFDFFIVSHPWMPMYLSAAIVLHQGSKVMKLECDMACVHSYLAKISDDLPFEDLILKSRKLLKSYPQEMLERDYVYLPLQQNYQKQNYRLFYSVVKSIKKSVPTKLTYSLVIAAAVLITAVLYQAYK